MKKIVIIGGCAAGPKAAAKSKRLNPNNIVQLYTKENIVSYSACGLPYFISGVVPNINHLIVRTPEEFEQQGVEVYLNHTLTKINPDKKTVIFNHIKEVEYDELILCVGSYPYSPNIRNFNLKNVFHLKVIEDGVNIKNLAITSKTVLLIGAGYIAIELLEAFVENNLKIIVVEKSKKVLPILDDEISQAILNRILENSKGLIEFIFEDEVVEFIGEDKFQGAITKNGKRIEADFCVVAVGVKPNVDIAKEAGVEIGVTGAIKVDNKMRTSIPNIFAAGDCTEEIFIPTKQSVYLALGTIANKQGRVAAINVNSDFTGKSETFDGILGSMITKFFNYSIAATGISEEKANELKKYINIYPISTTVDEYDKAGYMPEIGFLKVKLVADKITGEILGAQIVGTGDAHKRIGIVASILKAKLTVNEFLHLDLPYAPPFSSTIDPLLTCAYKLKQLIETW